jgi:hypothetical protein
MNVANWLRAGTNIICQYVDSDRDIMIGSYTIIDSNRFQVLWFFTTTAIVIVFVIITVTATAIVFVITTAAATCQSRTLFF